MKSGGSSERSKSCFIIKINPSFGLTKLISVATSQRAYPIGPLGPSALYPFGPLA